MISSRCYSRPMSVEEAFRDIEKGAGAFFNRQLVTAFLAARKEIMSVCKDLGDHEDRFLSLVMKNIET